MPTSFVTGANRGIGLEFAKQLSQRGGTVYAACRDPDSADELKKLDVTVVRLDVADPASVKQVAEGVEGTIDLLVNNAGVYGPQGGKQHVGDGDVDADEMTKVYRTNVAGPMLVLDAMLVAGKLTDGSKVVNISSGAGSIAHASGGSPLYYSSSKAALNMATKICAGRLRDKGVIVTAQCPGWVKTDMGGGDAKLSPQESIGSMLRHFDTLTTDHSGHFYNHDGSEQQW